MDQKKIGKVVSCVGGLYTVELENTKERISCRARGSFRHDSEKVLVGDNVSLFIGDIASGTAVETILERKNSLIRPPMANLDVMFLTLSASRPEPSLFTADKLISICEHNGIECAVIVGKCELDRERAEEIREIYTKAGYDVFVVSCFENEGIDELAAYVEKKLEGNTIAFAGASGAGKSTLLNRLFPHLKLATGEVSFRTERGKHTTRTVELFEAFGGYVADTPGFSMLDFERFDFFTKEDLPETFKEFRECIGECRYTKCTHTKEDGCAVIEKLKRGEIAASRHESFLALYETLKQKHDWNKK